MPQTRMSLPCILHMGCIDNWRAIYCALICMERVVGGEEGVVRVFDLSSRDVLREFRGIHKVCFLFTLRFVSRVSPTVFDAYLIII